MEKHIFLTGSRGCGKSAMLKDMLGPRLADAGGYVVQYSKGKEQFELFPAYSVGDSLPQEGQVFLKLSGSSPFHDNEVFREAGVRLLKEAMYYNYAIIDEFGSYELLIPQFREALSELLSSDVPTIGVLISKEDAEAQRIALGIGERMSAYVKRVWDALGADGDSRIVNVDGFADKAAREQISAWINEYL